MELLTEKISDKEYQMLEEWRNDYGLTDVYSTNEIISIKKLLQFPWEENKQNLYKLLGNNLILSKKFCYEKGRDEISKEINDFVYGYSNFGRKNRNGTEFIKNFKDFVKHNFPYNWNGSNEITKIHEALISLIDITSLIENRYLGENIEIPLPNGKTYRLQKNCKIFRALEKISNAYGIEGLEDFRICHSQIHNQKKISGEITLSIHPLDYWTMSDNINDWDSCMNWRDVGSYRQGTIEMMNSSCVVVAYLRGSENMSMGNQNFWNSKKWRQLFIVDKNVILGIKEYPYYNENLSKTVLKWIKELAETNLGWYYNDCEGEPFLYESNPLCLYYNGNPDKPFHLSFTSEFMYTDVGSAQYHYMYLGKDFNAENYYDENTELYISKNEEVFYTLNYSGASQCVACGRVTSNFDSESQLCCDDCIDSGVYYCAQCGERIHGYDYSYDVEGDIICENCFNENAYCCDVCGEYHYKANVIEIEIADSDQVNKICEDFKQKYHKNIYSSNYVLPVFSSQKTSQHLILKAPLNYICNDCIDGVLQKTIKDDALITKYNSNRNALSHFIVQKDNIILTEQENKQYELDKIEEIGILNYINKHYYDIGRIYTTNEENYK